MIFKLSELKDVCSKILFAVDSSESSQITDTLELKNENGVLTLNVTNREYFTKVKLSTGSNDAFHASVNAVLFLKLISSLTSEFVELDVTNNYLSISGDGNYKMPLIYDGSTMLCLPEITIANQTQSFDVSKEILLSILKYNLSELNKNKDMVLTRPIQKLFYLDNEGCITVTLGACVNSFKLPSAVKILLTPKIVKLFKLFKDDTVHFELGQDDIGGGTIQTKVKFSDSVTTLSAILPSDSSILNSMPVSAIRSRATCQYAYSVTLNKDAFLNAMKRLSLFSGATELDTVVTLNFKETKVEITDNKFNCETINYENKTPLMNCNYCGKLGIKDLKLTLETCTDNFIVMGFGNHQAMVISRSNVYNVMPEVI